MIYIRSVPELRGIGSSGNLNPKPQTLTLVAGSPRDPD